MIDNPEYKGVWTVKRISNPAYKGVWEAKKIANPEFVDAWAMTTGGERTTSRHVVCMNGQSESQVHHLPWVAVMRSFSQGQAGCAKCFSKLVCCLVSGDLCSFGSFFSSSQPPENQLNTSQPLRNKGVRIMCQSFSNFPYYLAWTLPHMGLEDSFALKVVFFVWSVSTFGGSNPHQSSSSPRL